MTFLLTCIYCILCQKPTLGTGISTVKGTKRSLRT